MPRTPCTTSPTMPGAAPIAARGCLPSRHLSIRQILEPRSAASTRLLRPQSVWCSARRSRITRSRGVTFRRMGIAKAKPIIMPQVMTMMGFAVLYPPTAPPATARAGPVPAPQPVVGQPRAAPPAIDRVMAAGNRQSPPKLPCRARGSDSRLSYIVQVAHAHCASPARRPLRQGRTRRHRGERKPFKSTNFPIVEHAVLKALLVMGKHIERMHVTAEINSRNRSSDAPSPVARPGSSSSISITHRRSCGRMLRSLPADRTRRVASAPGRPATQAVRSRYDDR